MNLHYVNPLMKPAYDKSGYQYFSVYMSEIQKSKKIKIHRLVALQHIPNPENLPQINHKDGVRDNNRVENLEWCTAAYNVSDGFHRGRVVWNKGNASKERIYGYCKKYPRQIFWLLMHDDFAFAKAFWGDHETKRLSNGDDYCEKCGSQDEFGNFGGECWEINLQQMVLEEEPLKYLEKFLDKE